ncbi:MAG: PHB depolymerase family esterase [Ilumatobacter sp.]|uniref:alpha/beta hydrolase family esterase n=1 Tax=Ilumatobacter sp. TaxID=1967498 RepID=UPI00329A5D3B
MRTARILAFSLVVSSAACSSGGSDDASPVVSPVNSDPAATVTSSPDTATDTSSPETSSSETTSSDTPSPDTSIAPASTDASGNDVASPAEVDGGGTGDEPLVIDGPAQVRMSCASLPQGVSEFTLEGGGAVHDVRIYVPETVSSDPAPVVLNWHGLGSSGPDQAAFSGYETVAEEEGFVVVHATGIDGGTGSNSWELAQFATDDRDDLAFADALIDTVVADWCGDPARIYSTGMSNGGLFTSELVCNRSARIAAAASIAGTTHAPGCDPERAVPYIAFHGTADDVVPFDADEPSVLLPQAGVDALIDDTTPGEFAEFAADFGCEPDPTPVEETPEVVRYDYAGCADDVALAFYEIIGGGHTWPSSPLSDVLDGFGYFTQDVDATRDAWAFMSQYSL